VLPIGLRRAGLTGGWPTPPEEICYPQLWAYNRAQSELFVATCNPLVQLYSGAHKGWSCGS
jgi:hypothetical protein